MKHIFISYLNENMGDVRRLYERLKAEGFEVWLDKDKIMPGERWQDAIRKAIRDGAFFIACFSKEYYSRDKTYMNEELAIAIEELRQRPNHRTWFIPVLLSDCDVPERNISSVETLRSFQYVKLYENWDDGIHRILSVIKKGLCIEETTENTEKDYSSGQSRSETVLMTNFSLDYKPPAPVIAVEIFPIQSTPVGKNTNFPKVLVSMLIDTGADMSIIPIEVIKRLEKESGMKLPYELIEVKDFEGQETAHKIYELGIKIKNNYHMAKFLEVDDEGGILGRDILNKYKIIFEGSKLQMTII